MDAKSQWDVLRLLQFVPAAMANIIKGIFLPKNRIEDKLVWRLASDGCYSVKSDVALLQGFRLSNPKPEYFIWIWKLRIPPKRKLFL